ncbi:MAG TPA: CO dehydrogenase/acetyl-CoA synthase subunit delta [Candidatus Altiarchaeales archaeon]|nr:CO dehydrogenase/acetyl-CoA synthase subunit delta [Candidatus Altiarchaeales archaeon]
MDEKELKRLLKKSGKIEIEDFMLDAEELQLNNLPQAILEDFRELLGNADEIEIENFELETEELNLNLITQAISKAIRSPIVHPRVRVEKFIFTPPKEEYKLRIAEVTFGAIKKNGGTRDRELIIGGESAMPYYFFEGEFPNKPVISHDVFDMPIHLPGTVRKFFGGKMEDPAEWAKLRVKKFNANMITLHLVSTDPNTENRGIKEAIKVVEDVLQAVKVPLIIGGSGNPEKDPELLAKAAEVCSGERCLLSTVDPDMDYKTVAKAAIEHGHSVLSLVSMNPDEMRRLNKNLLKTGLKREQIVMDLFTGGIGYGIEYSVSAMERSRWAGLKGDESLAMPIASATSNSWSAREAWMEREEWGPRGYRGPLWELNTAVVALESGADLFMMLHPAAIKTLQNIIDNLYGR